MAEQTLRVTTFGRQPRLMMVALLLAIGSLAGIASHNEAEAKNSWHIDERNKSITITVHADLVSGTDGDFALIEQSFADYWVQEFFTYGCYDVRFELDLRRATDGNAGGRHQIAIVEINPGDSFINEVWGRGDPTNDSTWVWLSNYTMPWVVAHEFGHVLGLPDEYLAIQDKNGRTWSVPDPTRAPEYTWSDDNDGIFEVSDVWRDDGDGLVQRNEWFPPTLKDGAWSSLMANADSPNGILDRHIKSIVEQHTGGELLACEWTGTLNWEAAGENPYGGAGAQLVEMTLHLEEGELGALTGTADASFTWENRSTDDCAKEMTVEPLSVQLDVTGSRTDETMTIEITGGDVLTSPLAIPPCGSLPGVKGDYYWAFPSGGVMSIRAWALNAGESGYTLDEMTTIPGPDSLTTVMVHIHVEPATDEEAGG